MNRRRGNRRENSYTEYRQQKPGTKINFVKLSVVFLIAINIICVASILLFNAYTLSIQTAKKNAHIKLVNNHPIYYRDLIENNANRRNLHPAYLSAIIKNESSFKTDARSNVGALGLMQLMPDTAQWVANKLKLKDYTFEKMADPTLNVEFGSWYLEFLSKKFDADPVLTTAAYHTGQGKVANWLADKSISDDGRTIRLEKMPDGPTKRYVERVLSAYAVYNALYFKDMQAN